MEIREPKPPGTLWATPGLLRDSFTFHLYLRSLVVLGSKPYSDDLVWLDLPYQEHPFIAVKCTDKVQLSVGML